MNPFAGMRTGSFRQPLGKNASARRLTLPLLAHALLETCSVQALASERIAHEQP